MTAARRVGCWDVSRCVYKAWLALVVESCRAQGACVRLLGRVRCFPSK
jgi:hypothetical protein